MSRACVLLLLAGCGRLGFAETPADAPDGSIDGASDGGAIDGVTSVCQPVPGPDTVALYTFDGPGTRDSTGAHDGEVIGSVEADSDRCGTGALRFTTGHVRIADSPAFDLPQGSIELYVRTPTPVTGAAQGLFSRDALNTDFDGHITALINGDGELVVRMQRVGLARYRCSGVVPADQWIHVGISFGPPGFRLWIDGVEATSPAAEFDGSVRDCTLGHDLGLDGNDNVFVVGATLIRTANSDPAPTPESPFTDGLIDQLHLRSTWIDFGAP